jgi:hypothetical protein
MLMVSVELSNRGRTAAVANPEKGRRDASVESFMVLDSNE